MTMDDIVNHETSPMYLSHHQKLHPTINLLLVSNRNFRQILVETYPIICLTRQLASGQVWQITV
jgi:hypothetical protein